MSGDSYELTKDYVFLGEGVADNALIKALCKKRNLPAFDYPFPDHIHDDAGNTISGSARFGDKLRLLAGTIRIQPRTRGILIAVDCGDNWKKSFDDVAKQIGKVAIAEQKLYPRPEKPLVATKSSVSYMPPLVIVMVPGVGRTGGMETLCVEVLRNEHEKTAGCLDGYLTCLDKSGVGIKTWGQEKQGKAEMQCLIAVTNRDDPNKAGRYVFSDKNSIVDVGDKAFNSLAGNVEAAVAALSKEEPSPC